ncbi:MAG: hypothetical protein VST68_00250 [Nitrospirota bacterium]|nr:hypothetical protein [Nitrospirota bacterium]
MNKTAELLDRRRYEKRGIAIKAQCIGRAPSEKMLETIQNQFSQKYGEGWKLDSVYPGAIVADSQTSGFEEGHMVIFKRRRQLRDE